ncbi:MAG: SRPBCC family protein [Phycisphaerales bacterium]|nr:SRPBCC family protein [Phycisphaerales bacterium]
MTTYSSTRDIPAPPEQVFAAIRDPERLARWWGPEGFTNTFAVCEFTPGGRWIFTMHGPNGRSYPNESTFVEIDPPSKVVIDHTCEPKYRLTIEVAATGAGTTVSWTQTFNNAETGKRLEAIVAPANEQNLDRLTAEVLHTVKAR